MAILSDLIFLFGLMLVFILPFGLIVGLVLGLSHLGLRRAGWHRLSEVYPYDAPLPKMGRRLSIVHIGGVKMTNSICCATDEEGIYLWKDIVFMRIGSPMRVPWSAVRIGKMRNSLFVLSSIELLMDGEPPVQVSMPKRGVEWIRDAQVRAAAERLTA